MAIDITSYLYIPILNLLGYTHSKKNQITYQRLKSSKHVELQLNHKIKSLHSDMGGEYTALLSFLATHGIQPRFSCPYTTKKMGFRKENIDK